MLVIWKYIRILSKTHSALPPKNMNTVTLLTILHPTELVATGNPVNSYLTSAVNRTHHGPVIIAPFSVQVLKIFSCAKVS